MVSAAILLLGIAAVMVAIHLAPDRRRRREAERLPLGADSAVVLRTLGPRPTRCPPGAMDHLAGQVSGLAQAQVDSAMAQLRTRTARRWLYPGAQGCTPAPGDTEVGLDGAGRVLWILPAMDGGRLRLSPAITF